MGWSQASEIDVQLEFEDGSDVDQLTTTMVDSKNQSAATSVESIASYHSKEVREVDCKNTEEQWSRLEKLKRRLKRKLKKNK